MINIRTYGDNKNPQTIAGSGYCRNLEVTKNPITMTNLISQPEIFKSIFGYEGLYEISNFGRIRTTVRYPEGRIVKTDLNSKGYQRVWFHRNKVKLRILVHRLVAMYFVPNPHPDLYDQINHKDGNKLNCHFSNLEWCNNSLNQLHRRHVLKQAK